MTDTSLRPPDRDAAAREARRRLAMYRESGPADLVLLLDIARALAAAGGAAAVARAGISLNWLREQGELVSRPGGPVTDRTPGNLHRLRKAFSDLNVPCDGWAVSDQEIAAAILRCARADFERAARDESPQACWQLFKLHGEGCIPDLNAIAPGARDLITGHAVRHLRRIMAADPDDWPAGGRALRELREVLPGLDGDAVAALRSAGIPVEPAGLGHAALVCDLRLYWLTRKDDDSMLLSAVCEEVLAKKTVLASEIGVTADAVWRTARDWASARARRIAAGDYEAAAGLACFAERTGLGYEPLGLDRGQVAAWEKTWIRDCWTRADHDGDGRAAFHVICHCEDGASSWDEVTGQPEARARARLQSVMSRYAAGLKRQAETAGSPDRARAPFRELSSFTALVRDCSDHSQEQRGKPLADASWQMRPGEEREFHDRYACGPAAARPPANR